MSAPAVSVAADARVEEVVRLLVDNDLSGLPVVDAANRLVGMVSDEAVVTQHAHPHLPRYLGILGFTIPVGTRESDEEIGRMLAVTASDLMDTHVATIGPNADVDDAATMMVEEHVNPIAVVDGDELLGVISRHSILALLLSEEEPTSDGR